jgi:hypothetical protein
MNAIDFCDTRVSVSGSCLILTPDRILGSVGETTSLKASWIREEDERITMGIFSDMEAKPV